MHPPPADFCSWVPGWKQLLCDTYRHHKEYRPGVGQKKWGIFYFLTSLAFVITSFGSIYYADLLFSKWIRRISPPSARQVGTKITIKDLGENFPPLVLILHTGVTEALPPGLTILVIILVILTLEHRNLSHLINHSSENGLVSWVWEPNSLAQFLYCKDNLQIKFSLSVMKSYL